MLTSHNPLVFENEISKTKKKFSKALTRDLFGHKKKVNCLGWNSTGERLASGSSDGTLRVWNQIKDSAELKGHTGPITCLCWNPSNPDVFSSGGDSSLRIWDVKSNTMTNALALKGEPKSMSWSPDGNSIACCISAIEDNKTRSDMLYTIDARKLKPLKIIKFHYSVFRVAFNKEGNMLYLTSGDGEFEIRGWATNLPVLHQINAHRGAIKALDVNPNGQNCVLGSDDSLVSLWDTRELVCLRTFTNLNSAVKTVSISHDGQFVASGSVETGENVATLECEACTNQIAWHPKRHLVAFAGDDKDKHGRDQGGVKVFGFSE